MRRINCPVDPLEKAWVEYRLQWLSAVLGAESLRGSIALTPRTAGIDRLELSNLADFIEFIQKRAFPNKTPYSLEFESQHGTGEFERESNRTRTLLVRSSQFDSVSALTANLIVELCHCRLQEYGQLEPDSRSDLLAELASVYLGLALYPANECVKSGFSVGTTMERLSVPVKQRNLPGRMFGYAIALWMHVRRDSEMQWLEGLRLDVREATEISLAYLDRYADSFFTEAHLGRSPDRMTRDQVLALIDDTSTSKIIVGLWQIGGRNDLHQFVLDRVLSLLEHSVPEVRWTAAQALALADNTTPALISGLVKSLGDRSGQVRASAATSLGYLCPDDESVIAQITSLLRDPDRDVACSAGWALGRFGSSAGLATSGLIKLLRQSLIDCEHWSIDILVGSLDLIVDEFEELIPKIVGPEEFDLHQLVLQALAYHRRQQES